MGNAKDMPTPRVWPSGNEWQAAKALDAQPDLIIEAEAYTMPAHHQDVWWRPVTKIPLTEPRWVRAVEMRPTVPKDAESFIMRSHIWIRMNRLIRTDRIARQRSADAAC